MPALRLTLWNGETVTSGTGRVVGGLKIADRATLLKLIIHPNLYFGEGYCSGTIQIDGDLVPMLEAVYRHQMKPGTPCARWGGGLMASAWFARHVVIDRWFLHGGGTARGA